MNSFACALAGALCLTFPGVVVAQVAATPPAPPFTVGAPEQLVLSRLRR